MQGGQSTTPSYRLLFAGRSSTFHAPTGSSETNLSPRARESLGKNSKESAIPLDTELGARCTLRGERVINLRGSLKGATPMCEESVAG